MSQKMQAETNRIILEKIVNMVQPDSARCYVRDGRWTPVARYVWSNICHRDVLSKKSRRELSEFDWIEELKIGLEVRRIEEMVDLLVLVSRRSVVQR
jgi:hypothetical protein